jgi:vacuolar-type H+-ATPase subunit E/Vma4
LAPLRAALLERARADAAAELAAADADAERAVEEARTQAEALVRQAREQGRADAAEVVALERARAQRLAREVVLGARAAAVERLRDEARAAVRCLGTDADYPRLRAALAERAGRELGPGAVTTESDGGGVVAVRGSRTLSYTLDGLADLLVDRAGAEVDGWWR